MPWGFQEGCAPGSSRKLRCPPGCAERKRRKFVSLKEIKTSDVEQGEAYMRTKQSIAKLMSDAERQYVAEYTQRSTPSGSARQVSSGEGGSQDIKVQKLAEGPNQGNLGNSIGKP